MDVPQADHRARALAGLFEQAPGFMALLEGPDYRFVLANPAYLAAAGCANVIGRRYEDILGDADGHGYLTQIAAVFETGNAFAAHGVRYGRDTMERYVDFTLQPIRGDDGAVTGVLVSGSDSTGRTIAELELRHKISLLQLIIETTPNVIYAKDAQGRMQLANRAALKLIGKSWEDVEGRTDLEFLNDKTQAERVMANDREVMANGWTEEFEEQVGIAGAAPRVFLSMKSPVRDVRGNIVGLAGISVDITERKRSEQLMRDNANQFQIFAQAMPNQVWTATPDGRLSWCNDRALEYTGLSFPQVKGDLWTKVIHPDDLPHVQAAWSQALATLTMYDTEYRMRRHDGTYRWQLARAVAIRPEGDAVYRWIGTNTDIEDQKFVANSLTTLNATLEEQVVERTAELMAVEESLRQSQKMEAVGQLTGGLAHDFNNLLTGISGSLELMETRIAQGRVREIDKYLHMAQSSVKRAASLTHRLLAFSRRQTLDPKPTDVNRLLGNLDELIFRTVGPAVTVEMATGIDIWPTLVDAHQLENALLNLCINARDAMPGGGCIKIETANHCLDHKAAQERELAPGEYVAVCVSDTGTGMQPDVIERAFDPFFTTKPLGEGTGLGLSMVYGFVRQSGGQARIKSEIGSGTQVCLYLPRYAGSEAIAEARPEAAVPHNTLAGETVLVVDDEPSIRMLIVEVLDELGYTALEAEDGRAGLKILESKAKIDLLITDVGLPGGMNGRQMADAALVSRPELKILFITGYAETVVVLDGHLRRGMHVMTKPFVLDELGRRIKEIVTEPK